MYSSNYLNHSGVKGMQWGKRRYQNLDGSLTEEGKIHYGRSGNKNNNPEDKRFNQRKNLGEAAANASRSAADIARNFSKKTPKNSPARSMSDKELRDTINRLNLERQYDQLTGADTRKGAVAAEKILTTTASVVSISVGVMTMIEMSRKLKNGG